MRKSCLISTLVPRPLNLHATRVLGLGLLLILVCALSTGCYVFRDFDTPPEQQDATTDVEPGSPDISEDSETADTTVDVMPDGTDADGGRDTTNPSDTTDPPAQDVVEAGPFDVRNDSESQDVVAPEDAGDDTDDPEDTDDPDAPEDAGDDTDDPDDTGNCVAVGAPNEAAFYCAETQSTCGNITVIDDCGMAHNVNCGTCQTGATCLGDATTFPRECTCDCEIGGECFAAGAEKPGNSCLICDPSESTTQWSPDAPKSCGASPSCSCNQSGSCVRPNGRDC